ncbi:glucocorticoid receptor-like DNA-binding domain protein [Tubulinosema ratisbonensis]|uniref:Glucocorticoid receptor-like DNA-binding domain protein n=1 Tax=Tubulinosema ratisbonensis TaxID=291195 RepID=A0A437AL00_9MICR|nr:glucocorticoid receptor-like DNA-binding domain protein [Tubulinosema ratisbonensis]
MEKRNTQNLIRLIKNYKASFYSEDCAKSARERNLFWRATNLSICLSESKLRTLLDENDYNFYFERENNPIYSRRFLSFKDNIFDTDSNVKDFSYFKSSYNESTYPNTNHKYSRYLVSPVPLNEYNIYYPSTYNSNYKFESYPLKRYNESENFFEKSSSYPKYSTYIDGNKVLVCSHCGTSTTSLWRKLDNEDICNACALYYKLHNKKRPDNLIKPTIRRRKRQKKADKVIE